eukprot:6193980-Pleurochrysis_carterae.AAC.1
MQPRGIKPTASILADAGQCTEHYSRRRCTLPYCSLSHGKHVLHNSCRVSHDMRRQPNPESGMD